MFKTSILLQSVLYISRICIKVFSWFLHQELIALFCDREVLPLIIRYLSHIALLYIIDPILLNPYKQIWYKFIYPYNLFNLNICPHFSKLNGIIENGIKRNFHKIYSDGEWLLHQSCLLIASDIKSTHICKIAQHIY